MPEARTARHCVLIVLVVHDQRSVRLAEKINERLWDFGDGIPEVAAEPQHTLDRSGSYRVTLIVWDAAGRGGRVEETVQVLAEAVRQIVGPGKRE